MDQAEVNRSEVYFQLQNTSDLGTTSSLVMNAVLYAVACGAVLLTVCGNLLVIISICHFKQLHTPTNLLLLSLAVTDLLIGLTVIPFNFALIIESCWSFGTDYCKVYKACSFILTSVSVYNVTFIAVDRYLAVQDPFAYAAKMTVNISLFFISLIWFVSLSYNIVILYFNRNFENIKNSTVCSVECAVTVSESWGIVDLMCVFLIPCSLMVVLYTRIFVIARKHVINISKHQSKERRGMNTSVVSERKAAQKLGILVAVFLMCYIPNYIAVFVSCTVVSSSLSGFIAKTTSLTFMNSTINPLIYALFYPWFQKCVKLILTCKWYKHNMAMANVLSKKE